MQELAVAWAYGRPGRRQRVARPAVTRGLEPLQPARLRFLALVVVVQLEACLAGGFDAGLALGPVAAPADQRANALGLATHHIQRVEAGKMDIECGASVLIEESKRALGGIVPGPIN